METVRAAITIKLMGREDEREAAWRNFYAEVTNAGISVGNVDGAQLYYCCYCCGLAINEVRNWQQQSKQTPLSFDRIVFFEGIGIHDESCMHDTCRWHTRAFQRAYRSAGDVELTNFSGGKFRTVHSI